MPILITESDDQKRILKNLKSGLTPIPDFADDLYTCAKTVLELSS